MIEEAWLGGKVQTCAQPWSPTFIVQPPEERPRRFRLISPEDSKAMVSNPWETGSVRYPFVFRADHCENREGLVKQAGKWCAEQFSGRYRIRPGAGIIWLRLEDDAFAFKMRWC